jgi:anti-sigma factor RsiW
MNCSRDLIEAYLDEELDPGPKASLEEHLSRCHACSETYSQFRAQQAKIRSVAPYYTAPPQLHRAVREALSQVTVDDFSLCRLPGTFARLHVELLRLICSLRAFSPTTSAL